MLNSELISQSIPFLRLQDKVSDALKLMSNFNVLELPVVDQGIYKGLYKEDYLLQIKEDSKTIGELDIPALLIAVNAEEHFLKTLKIAVDFRLTLVPVVKENAEFIGVVSNTELLNHLAGFFNVNEPGGLIVLETEGKNYSFAEISRLVETNDAQITQLNSFTDKETGIMLVTIKINKLEISDIVATFQRYEYHIKYYFGEEFYENEIRSNYDNLMNYLKI